MLDVSYRVDVLESGRTYKGVESTIEPAGKGLNVAKAVRRLGEEVTVVGLMPEANRRQFETYLGELDIRSAFYGIPGSVRVNTTVLGKKGNGVTHISARGAPVEGWDRGAFQEFLKRMVRSGDQWALSGSLPVGLPAGTYGEITALLRKKKVMSLLDSSAEAMRMGVKAKPSMIKPNLAELEEYFGEHIRGTHHIALKGKHFLDMGVESVYISLGSDGLIAVHGSDCLLCSVPRVQTVDTVGCGDALVAGILVGRKKRFSFTEICRLAVACGASNAAHPGAGEIDPEEVWSLTEDIEVTAV